LPIPAIFATLGAAGTATSMAMLQDVTKCYTFRGMRQMALLALPFFVPNTSKSATRSPSRARTVEREISRAVEARTFGTELNVFRCFLPWAVEMGCCKCRECRGMSHFLGVGQVRHLCHAGDVLLAPAIANGQSPMARFGAIWRGFVGLGYRAMWRDLARFGAVSQACHRATGHMGHGKVGGRW
jgi:hypothetical protein